MSARYNAVIVGQTGVGKSTLINYLYGKKVAEAGVGKPVTKNGFHPIDFEINGLPVCLFDSWGLEVGKHEEWLQDLDNEFKQRGVNEPADKWFHSVFYCINAGSARIQECDITIIKKFIAENYKVSVILTKADQISEDVEDILRKLIQSQINGLSVIGVCSEGKTRAGISQTFGKKDIERQAFNDFFDSLILRLPLRCKGLMDQALEDWVEESKEKAKDNIGIIGWWKDDVGNGIKYSATQLQKKMQELINTEIKKTFEMYGTFGSLLGYPPSELDDSNEKASYFKRIKSDNNIDTEEFEGLWWKISLVIVLIPVLLPIGIYVAKDSAIEEIEKYIYECKSEFQIIINNQVKDVTRMLESVKLKITGQ